MASGKRRILGAAFPSMSQEGFEAFVEIMRSQLCDDAANNEGEEMQAAKRTDSFNSKQHHALTLPDEQDYRITRVRITPEIAVEWAKRDTRNRISRRAERYAELMRRGEWREGTAETIKFGKSGKVLDGGNRLRAIADSGVTFTFDVAVGLDDALFAFIDQGMPRTTRSMLEIGGWTDWQATVGSTAAGMAVQLAKGNLPWTKEYISNEEFNRFIDEFPGIKKSVAFVEKMPRLYPPMPHSRGAWLHFEFAKRDLALADQFIEGLYTGENLSRKDPVFLLRRQLEQDKLRHEIKPVRSQLHAAIKAWNLARSGRSGTTSSALFPRSDEDFPTIK
jgi:hypothetical protein